MEKIRPMTIKKIVVISTMVFKPGMMCEYYVSGRKYYGLIVVSSGELLFEFADGRRRTLKAGEAVLFPKKIAYRVVNATQKDAYHYSINFSCHDEDGFEEERWFEYADCFSILKKCESIAHFWQINGAISKMRAIAMLYEILSDLFEGKLVDGIGAKKNVELMHLTNYIAKNLDKDLNIETLSGYCLMSKTNFRRIFTKLYSVSPIEYIIRVRLSKAIELIAMTSSEIFDIAKICGFNNVSYFYKLCKARTGHSPNSFRKNKIDIEKTIERIKKNGRVGDNL